MIPARYASLILYSRRCAYYRGSSGGRRGCSVGARTGMLSGGRSELVEGGKLDEGGGEGIGGLVVVLGALGAAAPVEADRVVAGLALALTVQASGLLFAAFNLAGFTGPAAIPTPLLWLGRAVLFRARHYVCRVRRRFIRTRCRRIGSSAGGQVGVEVGGSRRRMDGRRVLSSEWGAKEDGRQAAWRQRQGCGRRAGELPPVKPLPTGCPGWR